MTATFAMNVERSWRKRPKRKSSLWSESSERFHFTSHLELFLFIMNPEAEPVPKKDKLTKLKVGIGNNGKEVTIVTNAKHCEPEKVNMLELV